MKASIDAGEIRCAVGEREYESFVCLYRGREDRVGVHREGRYQPVEGGLTYERFCAHVGRRETYGLYPLDDEARVRLGLFDFDVLPRAQGWESLLPRLDEERMKARRLISFLRELGLPDETFLVEFPTVGYHVLLFLDEPTSAAEVKRFMRASLAACGLDATPSYPRAVELPGDCMQLPFRTNKNTGRRSNLVRDLDSFDPRSYDPNPDFAPLERVVPLSRELFRKVSTRV